MRRGIRITLYIAALALVSLGVGVVCRWYLPPADTVSTAVCERSEVAVGDAVDVICTASLPWRDRVQEVSADLAPEGRLRLINWSATYLGTSWGAHEWLVTAQVQALAALAGVEPTQWLFAAQLDLNRAAASSLEVLPGIGPARAQAIVAERCRARFERVEEIERVRGIGPALRAGLAARVKVGPAADQRVGAGCPAVRD